MENLIFDYDKLVEQSEALTTAAEKIEYYKKVLDSIDEFYTGKKMLPAEKTHEILTPEEKIKYFEKMSAKNFIRTKIFLEELESSPDYRV